jgi:hypothetical protein
VQTWDWVPIDQTLFTLKTVSTSPTETVAELEDPSFATASTTALPPRRLRSLGPDLLIGLLLIGAATLGVYGVRRVVTRPLWYDEQWRAYFFSLHGHEFWNQIHNINAPNGLLYVGAVKLSTATFGQHPWALRLPAAVAVPVLAVLTYAYARRFVGRAGSVLVALVVAGSSGALSQSLQLKPYLVEAAATAAVLLLWAATPAPGTGRRRRRVILFTIAAVISCIAVPGVFLIVPLVVAEPILLRADLRRRVGALLDVLPALAISLLHTGLFVGAQAAQRHTDYWNFAFTSGRDPSDALHFLVNSTRNLAAGTALAFTSSSTPVNGVQHLGWVASAAAAVVIAGWVMAAATVWRTRPGRQLLIVCGCFLGGSTLASELRYWPYGLIRTNIFIIPALAVLAVAGWAALWRIGMSAMRSPQRRWQLRPPAAVALSAMAAAACGVLVLDGARLEQWRIGTRNAIYGDQLAAAAFYVRAHARPGELVAYGDVMAIRGWQWALDAADGPRGLRRIPATDQLAFMRFDDGSVARALRAHAGSDAAYLYIAKGVGPGSIQELRQQFTATHWCASQSLRYPTSGLLLKLSPCRT